MKRLIFLSILLALTVMSMAADQKTISDEEGVLILTDETYSEALAKYPKILIEHYTPTCENCKSLALEYAKAAQLLKEQSIDVVVAKIDATQQTKVAAAASLQDYPALIFYSQGKEYSKYSGERTTQPIVDWIKTQIQSDSEDTSAIVTIASKDELQRILHKGITLFVYFGKKEGSSWELYRSTIAKFTQDDTFGFAVTLPENLYDTVSNMEEGDIMLFRRDLNSRKMLKGPYDELYLYEFILENQKEKVTILNEDNLDIIFGDNPKPALFLIKGNKITDEIAEKQFYKASEILISKIKMVIADFYDHTGESLAQMADYNEEDLPQVAILQPHDHDITKFPLKKQITAANIVELYEDYRTGKAKRFYISEEEPESNAEPVKIVVSKSFKKNVIDNDKDVLVNFYVYWCGQCQALAPTYELLAKRLAKSENLIIAKVDMTKNQLEEADIKSFPTIYFYASGDKKNPIEYEGDRSENSLVQFIRKHAKHTIIDAEEEAANNKGQEL